jgi:UTP--glucose-1-phosphate uridylyltransferase
VRKAVIPAAGLGTRFLPATKAQPKEMLPVVDKPAIQYVVEEAVDAGLEDVLVVTGRGKRSVEDHFDRALELEEHLERAGKLEELAEVRRLAELARIHYVRQAVPLGLGHAVALAKAHVGDEAFAVLLPDDLMDLRAGVLRGMLSAHARTGASVLALKKVGPAEIARYGAAVVEPGPEGLLRVRGLVEKPAPSEAPSDWAVLGRYVLAPGVFEALERVGPGAGGELQLTDGIALLAEAEPVYGYPFAEGRYDVGDKLDFLRATIELALGRADLGPALGAMLARLVAERGLTAGPTAPATAGPTAPATAGVPVQPAGGDRGGIA